MFWWSIRFSLFVGSHFWIFVRKCPYGVRISSKTARPLFVFKICRLLFPTLLDFICFILLDCPSFASSADFQLAPILFFRSWRVKKYALAFCVANFWWRVLLSCRLNRLGLNSVSSCFRPSVLLIYQAVSIDCGQLILLLSTAVKQKEFELGRAWVPRLCTPRALLRKFPMTYSIVLQINAAEFE